MQIGDIGAVKAAPKEQRLLDLITPKCDRWHHFLVISKTEIIEAAPSGVIISPITAYDAYDVKYYRYYRQDIAEQAAQEALKFVGEKYDYILFAKLFGRALDYWMDMGAKPVPYTYFRIQEVGALICTAVVVNAFHDAGGDLIYQGVTATPNAIEQARIEGRLKIIGG
jgi:hypothetical protein